MDEERSWQRITEVVRQVSQAQDVPVPAALERVSGDVWQRDAQRREALASFAQQIEDFPLLDIHSPAEQIADVLDAYWFETQPIEEDNA